MLKLFRKTRQTLLNQGKTIGYLKYAVGEIILVVIGILIALNINNWNIDRNNQKRLSNYRVALIEDLKSDTTSIGEMLRHATDKRSRLESLTSRLSQDDVEFDLFEKIVRDSVELLFIRKIAAFNSVTFDAIKTTGDINLFNKELSRQLMNLYNNQITALDLTNSTYTVAYDRGIDFVEDYLLSAPAARIKSGPMYKSILKSLDQHQFVKDFNASSINTDNYFRLVIREYKILFDESNRLLVILDSIENKN